MEVFTLYKSFIDQDTMKVVCDLKWTTFIGIAPSVGMSINQKTASGDSARIEAVEKIVATIADYDITLLPYIGPAAFLDQEVEFYLEELSGWSVV